LPIELKAGSLTLTANVVNRGVHTSKSTGNRLAVMEVEFTVQTPREHKLVTEFQRYKGPILTNTGTDSEMRWKLSGNSGSSFRSGSSRVLHHWELLQVEDLNIENLVIADLQLTPYTYSEEFSSDGVLAIEARVSVTEAQEKRIRELEAPKIYFPVIRQGINNEPREMRFGKLFWSQHGSTYKMDLFLVDKAADDNERPDLSRIEFNNLSYLTAEHGLQTSKLVELLLAKKVITETEADDVFETDLQKRRRLLDLLLKVEDVDKL
jgi:hypothetical protein